jgi:riboflavin kinase/FMN adenylyltransferase
VHDDGEPVLEVYLLDFNQEIYGHHLRVHFLRKLRDEHKYADLEMLIRQIEKDVACARAYFLSYGSDASGDFPPN